MNKKIILTKKQTKAIAQEIYGDVKEYCRINIERYVPWYLNELRKSNGQPLLKLDTKTYCNPQGCSNCEWEKLCEWEIDRWDRLGEAQCQK